MPDAVKFKKREPGKKSKRQLQHHVRAVKISWNDTKKKQRQLIKKTSSKIGVPRVFAGLCSDNHQQQPQQVPNSKRFYQRP